MNMLFQRRDVMEILEETGNTLLGAGDHSLAISMLIIGVPVARNPCSSKHFERSRLSLTGGNLAHIHYVDWQDKNFVQCMHALTHGQKHTLTFQHVQAIIDQPLEFGRCIGQKLAVIHLRNSGVIEGGNSGYECLWKYVESCLLIVGDDHRVSTIFDSIVQQGQETWLIGSFVHEGTKNYLRIKAGLVVS